MRNPSFPIEIAHRTEVGQLLGELNEFRSFLAAWEVC
ncbi:hypothetical protein KR51_00024350 [Rubidibacter lacunae KORDI 51-2]|uniref:Uncharacterized protein n=1 Tax=Rubidibacter lacunae KORDI 51-2 TaxID=582515 RepID=U5DHC9_9CHRO|nr:hypothetical protein KR51_00024350 [Rubidibacter lacunae KORDI 51-2]